MYDYLVIGAGMFGATFAWHARQAGKSVIVVDSRDHIGGNCYTYDDGGIQVHKYGPHIFHTSSKRVWDFVNKFATFNNYTHRVKTINGDKVYSLPINMMTLHQLFGVTEPDEAIEVIESKKVAIKNPRNLKDWVLSQVGSEVYEALIEGYTTKQWGRDPSQLPSSYIRRLPIRTTWDDRYFNDTYEGIPIGGYTRIFEGLLEGCELRLKTDFFEHRAALESVSEKTVYTGMIDEFFEHSLGWLEYRTLDFDTQVFNCENYQGIAQLNNASLDKPWTRSVEHKHFDFVKTDHTVVTWETPREWKPWDIPYYPINDDRNTQLFEKYKEMASREPRTLFGGRLAKYLYMDMHQVIAAAMTLAEKEGLVKHDGDPE